MPPKLVLWGRDRSRQSHLFPGFAAGVPVFPLSRARFQPAAGRAATLIPGNSNSLLVGLGKPRATRNPVPGTAMIAGFALHASERVWV